MHKINAEPAGALGDLEPDRAEPEDAHRRAEEAAGRAVALLVPASRAEVDGGVDDVPVDGEEQAVPYTPPLFREPGDRLVVAVRSHDELEPARALMSEVSAAAIVLADGGAR